MNLFYRLAISLVALATFTVQINAQVTEGKQTVALLEFEGRGISQLEAKTLTDRLMSEMVNTDAVIMVERNQMDEILNEQGFQQSGCTSSECAAEVGALLGVQNMVSGSIRIPLMQRCSQLKPAQPFARSAKHTKAL
jgi:curli biogenesis system outer membrane secretion channel CsgG